MVQKTLGNRVHRLKIVLEGTRPQVWRRLEVPSVTGLGDLHMLIQVVMGWNDSHPHSFEFSGLRYSGNEGLGLGPPDRDEHAARVGDVLRRRGSKGVYTYDFGDSWEHSITVEAVGEAEPDTVYPRLLDGHGGGPPEDCGGVYGFEHLRHLRDHPEELGKGFHADAEDQRNWVEMLEPDDLDLEAMRRELREAFGSLPLTEETVPAPEPSGSKKGLEPARPVSLPPEEELAAAALESSPLRELLALARWFGEGKALTSTGMPRPADVRAAAAELDLWPRASARQAAERADRLGRLRAARDLPGFVPLWRWVTELGLVRVEAKRVSAAPEVVGELTADSALEAWWELFDAAVEGDPDPEGLLGTDRYEADLFPPVLRFLYEAPDGTELVLGDLASELADHLLAAGAALPDEAGQIRLSILTTIYRGLHHLAEIGAVHLSDRTEEATAERYRSGYSVGGILVGPGPDTHHPQEGEVDCSAALTPLGRHGVRRVLLREGVPAPLSGGLAGASAAELLDSLMTVQPDLHEPEILPWLAGRATEEAVVEVVEAASALDGTGAFRRALALRVLEFAGEPALPVLRGLLDSDRISVAALAAGAVLAAADLPEEEHSRLSERYGPWLAIDMVAAPLERGEDHLEVLFALNTGAGSEGPGPIGQLLLDGGGDLWKVDHPEAFRVLEAVGRLHPDKKVAKAARRAAHKARSRS
ncbi:plasmid pRiA4b ORF-3 family protein [Nocardiopsis valliformis]|uniref:plasmid pRiA4b ORF-3 family protein n=1 Tax=Nocardiopsis valliformis TaxID=239974 RepID=UPI00034BEFF0|nr:plasmid pRiA4b ORF-3 family protein [Nocardiopsis valliformis]